MTKTNVEIGSLITFSSEIRQGKPIIAGTGVRVVRIVSWYKLGLTPEEILSRIGHPNIDLAKIYAALTYYHANRAEIENDIAIEEGDAKRFEGQWLNSKA